MPWKQLAQKLSELSSKKLTIVKIFKHQYIHEIELITQHILTLKFLTKIAIATELSELLLLKI